MPGKESYLEKLERAGREQLYEMSLRGEEFIKARLQWENWEWLLPRLAAYAKQEIGRRRWRGKRSGVLPDGYDANSIAAEVVAGALQGKARLARGWTLERLEKELQRLVSNEVRRLHKKKETSVMRSEWEVLPPDANNEPRSVFSGMRAEGPSGLDANVVDAQVREKQKAELRIAERLRGGDEMVEKLFWCLREGMVKRRKIASRLGVSVEEVTNCRKRLNRKLGEMARTDAGVPRWVVEELLE
jgi:hypothetical protein